MKFVTVRSDNSLPPSASMSSINRFLTRRHKHNSDTSGLERVMFPPFHTPFILSSSTPSHSLTQMLWLSASCPCVHMPLSALSNLKARYSQCVKLAQSFTHSCIANISERWLSQPKQTSALLRSLFSPGNSKPPTKDETENVGRPLCEPDRTSLDGL